MDKIELTTYEIYRFIVLVNILNSSHCYNVINVLIFNQYSTFYCFTRSIDDFMFLKHESFDIFK